MWEGKLLRNIFGGKGADIYKEPDVIAVVKAQRLGWRGHVEKMELSRIPKRVLKEGVGGRKRRGRHKKRCRDEVRRDVEMCGIINGKEKSIK